MTTAYEVTFRRSAEHQARGLGAGYCPERFVRRGKFAAGAKMEAGYRRADLDARVAHKPSKGRSEKSRSAWRNDPVRDEKIFKFINACLRSKQQIRVTSCSRHIVWTAKKNLREAKLYGLRVIPKVGLPHWDHSSEILKMLGWSMASHEMGATPFTLRLSDNVIVQGKSASRGFGWYMQDRMRRHLRLVTGDDPAFWFIIEQGLGDEPHLHGAVVMPCDRKEQVREALCAVGGAWRSKVRQCQFGQSNNLIRWIGYCTKWLWRSKAFIGNGAVVGAANIVRRRAKECYQRARETGVVIYP